MLKHVVIFALFLTGATAPHAAEKAVRPATPVSQPEGARARTAPAIDPAKRAWIGHVMDHLLDADDGDAGAPPHDAR